MLCERYQYFNVYAEVVTFNVVLQEDENRSESAAPREVEYDDDNEDLESDADDFIVDDDGRPIAERKKKRKPIFTDALVFTQ